MKKAYVDGFSLCEIPAVIKPQFPAVLLYMSAGVCYLLHNLIYLKINPKEDCIHKEDQNKTHLQHVHFSELPIYRALAPKTSTDI